MELQRDFEILGDLLHSHLIHDKHSGNSPLNLDFSVRADDLIMK